MDVVWIRLFGTCVVALCWSAWIGWFVLILGFWVMGLVVLCGLLCVGGYYCEVDL